MMIQNRADVSKKVVSYFFRLVQHHNFIKILPTLCGPPATNGAIFFCNLQTMYATKIPLTVTAGDLASIAVICIAAIVS